MKFFITLFILFFQTTQIYSKPAEIIQNKEITKLIKVIVICAYDISGAVNIIENLEQNELEDKLLIISGPVTNNVSAYF